MYVCIDLYILPFYFNTHMNICISVSKLLTLKLELLSCSQPDCFDLLFLMHLFIYSGQTLILLLIMSSTLKLGKILFP